MTTRNNTKPKTIIKQNTGSTINEVIDANENQLLSSKSSVKIITLIISDTSQMKIDLKLAVKGYPNILSILNLNTCELYLPDWMDIKNLKDYFLYVKLSYDSDEQEINQSVSQIKFNFKKLIQLVNYFENDVIFEHMIKMNIITQWLQVSLWMTLSKKANRISQKCSIINCKEYQRIIFTFPISSIIISTMEIITGI